jgi:xanthosine utilization system XapX-like protein
VDPLLFGLLIGIAPSLGVALIGIVFSILQRHRHPHASLLAAIGLLGLSGSKAGGVWWQLWLRDSAMSGHNFADMAARTAIANYSLNALSAAGLALVTIAVFVERTQAPRHA